MAESLQILVVDDEPAIRQVLVATLKKAGYTTESAENGSQAMQILQRGDIDVTICDINMPGMDGIELMRQVKESGIETVFLIMTAFASVDTAIRAMKAGAYDYLTKPLRKEDVLHRLGQVANMISLQNQNRTLRNLVREGEKDRCRLPSPACMEIDRLIRKIAPTDYTVLITGESGTGKGVLARQIHRRSNRANALFIPVNCGSIPDNLLESEFFGHTKGAFTGADRVKKGLFIEADQGTLFLDEIGELPLLLQVKLLHAIEEKQIRSVGSENFRKVDVRIISATNKNLLDMVANGTFREDLYFRLNVFNIHIAPLRERREDIPVLVQYILERNAQRNGLLHPSHLDGEAEAAILSYDWPGNVRELENVLERALILAEDGIISIHDLPANVCDAAFPRETVSTASFVPSKAGNLRDMMRDHEVRIMLQAIEEASGDRRKAAQILGIGLSSLYRKLEQANISTDILK